MNRNTAILMSREVKEALTLIAEKHGVTLEYGRNTWKNDSSKGSWVFKERTASGEPVDFQEKALRIGIDLGAYGMIFVGSHDNKVYKINGINTRARKYPVTAVNLVNKKIYKFTAEYINRQHLREPTYSK